MNHHTPADPGRIYVDHRGLIAELAARLHAARVPVRLMLVQDAGRGLDSPSQGPGPDRLTDLVADFLTRTMGGSQHTEQNDRRWM